jgi:DNA-binding NarL/FixJ family response regulator
MKFLVVDDHTLIREAMRGVLKELEVQADVLEAASCGQALELVARHSDISLVLLDLMMPDRDGFEALGELRERYPATAVVMLSGLNDRDNVVRALEGGAVGFIPKTASREVLIGALGLILAGGIYIPPEALTHTLVASAASPPPVPKGKRPSPTELGLTERQIEVLALMMQGRSNKMICRALDLAEPTVKNHVSAILRVLGVVNRTEAVIAVTALGWDLSTHFE